MFNTCLRKGSVSFGDDLDTVSEVTGLWGLKATKLPFHNWFKVPNQTDTISCLLSEDGGNGWHNVPGFGAKADERGWNEILTIAEYNDDVVESRRRIDEELARPLTRYVFWRKSRDGAQWYKFFGAFKIDADATRATRDTEHPRTIYRRYETTAPCLKVDVTKQAFTDEEFKALKGRIVRVNFLDEIGFTADCGKSVTGEVTAWPGTKLLVTDVASGCVNVKCDTKDEDLLAEARQHVPARERLPPHARGFSLLFPQHAPLND